MAKLSDHFRRHELACHCCGQCNVSPRLIEALEELRGLLSDSPIHITSGCRCVSHNDAVGGVHYSRHTVGEAADIAVQGHDPVEVAMAAEKVTAIRNGGIGVYGSFTHIDVGYGDDRPARWQG